MFDADDGFADGSRLWWHLFAILSWKKLYAILDVLEFPVKINFGDVQATAKTFVRRWHELYMAENQDADFILNHMTELISDTDKKLRLKLGDEATENLYTWGNRLNIAYEVEHSLYRTWEQIFAPLSDTNSTLPPVFQNALGVRYDLFYQTVYDYRVLYETAWELVHYLEEHIETRWERELHQIYNDLFNPPVIVGGKTHVGAPSEPHVASDFIILVVMRRLFEDMAEMFSREEIGLIDNEIAAIMNREENNRDRMKYKLYSLPNMMDKLR
jgi:hypothetical protein